MDTANIKVKLLDKEICELKPKATTDQFKCGKMRVRITKLDAHTDVPMHIDYDPTYATRVVIPVYTNPKVKNRFKKGNVCFRRVNNLHNHFNASIIALHYMSTST